MGRLENNDWLVMNNIIYKIYTTEDELLMRQNFIEQLKLLMDYDSADFFVSGNNGETELVRPVLYNCNSSHTELYPQIDYSRGIWFTGQSLVYRETDIISDEKRMKMDYYKNVYRPNHWHYSLQLILSMNKKLLGVVTFYRTLGKENFQYEDIFILDMLKEHLSYRMSRDMLRSEIREEKLTIKETVEKYQLTKREETILEYLMDGADNTQICNELVISLNTLKKHILNIYRKLGIRNRVQLFKMVREHAGNQF